MLLAWRRASRKPATPRPCKRRGSPHIGAMHSPPTAIAKLLDRATYEGYRVGFEAARAEAALLAERAGQRALAAALRAMEPLPDKGARQ